MYRLPKSGARLDRDPDRSGGAVHPVGTRLNAIGSHTSMEGGTAGRIFARFLTWMKEKTAMVFVAATANRIESLPAEILRKGRFDQLFFLDLPSEKERMDIYRVHLVRRGQDITKFNLVSLGKGSRNFSGAEIEQVVLNALTDVTVAGRALTENELFKSVGSLVPLATTMAEQTSASFGLTTAPPRPARKCSRLRHARMMNDECGMMNMSCGGLIARCTNHRAPLTG